MGSDNNYWTRTLTRRTSRRGQLKLMAGAGMGVAGAALVGCGGDDDEDPGTSVPAATATTGSGSGTPAPTTAATTAPAETPKTGGRIKTLFPADFQNFDFGKTITSNTLGATGMFAQTLLRYSYDSPIDKTVNGHLAEDWEQVDAQTFVLNLDGRAKWQDIAPVSGRAVVAEDIKATFDRILDPATGTALIRQIGDFVDRVEATSERQVTLKLKLPLSGLQNIFGACFFYMMPREGAAGAYDPRTVAIGSGPFVVSASQVGAFIKYDRNPNYWKTGPAGEKLPYVDGVDYTVVADPNQAFNALITGDVSFNTVTYTNTAGLRARNPSVKIYEYPTAVARSIFIPARPGTPYEDIRVRQATKYAVNQDEIIQRVYNGNAKFTSIITPASESIALPEAEARQIWGHDLAKARQLIDDAGFANGVTLPLQVSSQHAGQVMLDIAQVLAAQVAEIGITFDIRDVDSVTANANVLNPDRKDYGAALSLSAANSGGDELDWLYKGYAQRGLYNLAQDPESTDQPLQDLIQKMIGEFDPQKRLELVYDIQRRVGEIAIAIPTPAPFDYHAHQENVRNYGPHISEFFQTSVRKLDEVWLA